jgi:hypothetical protein
MAETPRRRDPGCDLVRSEYEHADGGSLRNATQERVRATEWHFSGMSSPSEGRGHTPEYDGARGLPDAS